MTGDSPLEVGTINLGGGGGGGMVGLKKERPGQDLILYYVMLAVSGSHYIPTNISNMYNALLCSGCLRVP